MKGNEKGKRMVGKDKNKRHHFKANRKAEAGIMNQDQS